MKCKFYNPKTEEELKMNKVKEHGIKGDMFTVGADGHKIGTIHETAASGRILAEEMGIDYDQYKRLWFLVTDKGVPMVVDPQKSVDINSINKTLKTNGITAIILHDHWFTGVVSSNYTEENKDFFWKFTGDARIGRSPEDVVRHIINEADGITKLL